MLISIDYGDDTPAEWKLVNIMLPHSLQSIHDYAISHEISLNTIAELTNHLSDLRPIIENNLIEDMFPDEKYVHGLCGGKTATIKKINEAVDNYNEATVCFFQLDDATNAKAKNHNVSTLPYLTRVRNIDESYTSKNPFNDGWKFTIQFYDPNAEWF